MQTQSPGPVFTSLNNLSCPSNSITSSSTTDYLETLLYLLATVFFRTEQQFVILGNKKCEDNINILEVEGKVKLSTAIVAFSSIDLYSRRHAYIFFKD